MLGIDFSGAQLAGLKIWVSRAYFDGEVLSFDFLSRAADLPGSSPARDVALSSLRGWIAKQGNVFCGFDFPFSIASQSIETGNWHTWLADFAQFYPDANSFKANLPDVARKTDKAAKTPFSPLNLRLYRQTYYGIRDVLAPLVEAGARALPFAPFKDDELSLIEICPASLLKKEGLYFSYKGKSAAQSENRARILESIGAKNPFRLSDELKQLVVDDTEGDALDAILAAICTNRALQNPQSLVARDDNEKIEGRVFF